MTSTRSSRTPPRRRILGIDPGFGRLGYGAIDVAGGRLTAVEYGCLTTPVGAPRPARLANLASRLRALLGRLRPDVVAVEELFFSKNVKTALGVSEARGVVLLTAEEAGCATIDEYTPQEVKVALTGYGNAAKRQVQRLVERFLRLDEPIASDDAADALGIAICAAQTPLRPRP